jgi:transcriptional regulator with XRE-family HTH domain
MTTKQNGPDPERRQLMADRLREARTTRGLTQIDVEREIGIHRSGISDIETGHRGVTALEIHRLSRLYGRSVAWLVGDDDEEETDIQLLRIIQDLTDGERAYVLTFARFLASPFHRKAARR